jgi:hypothetical protein
MSHFAVLVVGKNVEEQLAPYHEFECTGDDNSYVQDIDNTEEARKEYQSRDNSEETFAEFCESCYGHMIVPFNQQPDLSNEHKYGYTLVDGKGEVIKTVDRTNPNRKWDWYQVGGRWTGYFKLKQMAVGVLGEPGLQRMDKGYVPPSEDRADSCLKGDIDIEGMREEAGEEAAKRYDLFAKVTEGLPVHLSWDEVKRRNIKNESDVDYEKARKEYGDQPVVKALHNSKETMWFEADDFLVSREQYIQRARDGAFTLFAVVKDGQWYERGSMGWWGCVSDEKDRDEWNQKFSSLIDDLSDDTILTVVDCHI